MVLTNVYLSILKYPKQPFISYYHLENYDFDGVIMNNA